MRTNASWHVDDEKLTPSLTPTMLWKCYHSDDIDPATGKIDNNLIKFDERNISKKYQLIQAAAKAIIDGGSPVPGFSVSGFSFLLSAKAVPDNAVYSTTLRITGNETGGEVIVNIYVSRQTIGGEQTQSYED